LNPHSIELKFNFTSIQFNYFEIQLKRNVVQIGTQGIENMLITSSIRYQGVEGKNNSSKKERYFLIILLFHFKSMLMR